MKNNLRADAVFGEGGVKGTSLSWSCLSVGSDREGVMK